MPVIELHILEGYSDQDKSRMGEALTDAIRIVVPAPPEAVTVMMHEMAPSEYMRGRQQRTPAPALPCPTQIVRQFLTAMQDRDLEAAQSFLGLGFRMTFPGGKTMGSLKALLDWAAPRYRFVTKTYDGFDAMQSQGAHAVVYCRGTLSGEWPDGTPFEGIRFIDRFEVTDGLLTQQDVWNDLSEHRSMT